MQLFSSKIGKKDDFTEKVGFTAKAGFTARALRREGTLR